MTVERDPSHIAAETISKTMGWAEKQADIPAFRQFEFDGDKIRFVDLLGRPFEATVRMIEQ
jgi:hypothetical protein